MEFPTHRVTSKTYYKLITRRRQPPLLLSFRGSERAAAYNSKNVCTSKPKLKQKRPESDEIL
jgi:hypothetical protein